MSSILKSPLAIILMVFVSLSNYAQSTVPVNYYFKKHFIFNSGFWVYQDSSTNAIDSITLETIKHGFMRIPIFPDYYEYYQVEYYSHSNDSSYNDFFYDNLWRVNGGGQWAELGQPVMWVNQWGHS